MPPEGFGNALDQSGLAGAQVAVQQHKPGRREHPRQEGPRQLSLRRGDELLRRQAGLTFGTSIAIPLKGFRPLHQFRQNFLSVNRIHGHAQSAMSSLPSATSGRAAKILRSQLERRAFRPCLAPGRPGGEKQLQRKVALAQGSAKPQQAAGDRNSLKFKIGALTVFQHHECGNRTTTWQYGGERRCGCSRGK